VTWLVENYAPPAEALDPASFKVWQDTVFPNGGADNYIDYLCGIGVLSGLFNAAGWRGV
jgi:hypothetical protein